MTPFIGTLLFDPEQETIARKASSVRVLNTKPYYQTGIVISGPFSTCPLIPLLSTLSPTCFFAALPSFLVKIGSELSGWMSSESRYVSGIGALFQR